MPRLVPVIALLATLALGAASGVCAQTPPDLPYNGEVAFTILRNGNPVGHQQASFARRGDALVVTEMSDIKIDLAFIPLYRFHYDSVSEWHDGALLGLRAATDDNGKEKRVTARIDGDHLAIDGPRGRFDGAKTLILAAHWNPAERKQSELLNSIDGKIDQISVTDAGPDSVPAPEGRRAAHRFVFQGDLRFTVWYDAADHWVGLRFKADDGSDIDYVCERCGAPPS